VQLDDAGGRLLEAGGAEDLRADVAVQSHELQAGQLADARDGRRGVLEREAELLVLVGRGQEVVRLGVHAAVDPDQHGLRAAAALDDRREPLDLDETVDDDRPDPDLDRALELGDRLVVAVEAETRGIGARRERHGELAAGAHVDREPLFGDPPHHLGAEEGLAGVVDPRLHAVQRRRGAERIERPPRGGAHLVLVQDVQGGSEALTERRGGDAAERQDSRIVAAGRGGPHGGREAVRIGGRLEPGRSDGAGVRVGGHGGPIGGGFDAVAVRATGCGANAGPAESRPWQC
jgi:hypothetical protein